jgi:branched-chain amino acid transport system ATP-binding protein
MRCYRRRDKAGIAVNLARMFDDFPKLAEGRQQVAGTLSGGEQQMLAIAHAQMSAANLCWPTSRRWA